MFRDLPLYSETRATALPWASTLPSHWRIERAKSMMRAIDVRSVSGDEELLTVSSGRGVIPRASATVSMFKAESYVGHKLCWPNDLVINSLWAWGRGLGIAQHHGIVSAAYGVYRHHNADLDPSYLHELVRSEPFQWELQVRSHGVWKSRLLMSDERWLDAPLLVPPAEEQAVIVKYLAHANARIDKAIAAKRRLIALLEEQEQANAESLVRGDTEQDQISTGFPWLSRVPASWELLRIKKVLVGIEQGWSPQCDAQPAGPDEWGVLKAGCSNHGRFRSEENKKLPDGQEPRPELEVQHGDLLVSRANTRELVGSAAVALNPREKLIFSDKTFRLKVRADRADTEFLALVMGSRSSRDQIEAGAVGASHSMQNIGQGVIANLWIGLPPVDVQKAIVDELHRRSEEFEAVVGKTRREIALLREFRTRLVADVVTGQVDVRAIAATLPEAPESFDTAVPALDDELEEVLGEGEG